MIDSTGNGKGSANRSNRQKYSDGWEVWRAGMTCSNCKDVARVMGLCYSCYCRHVQFTSSPLIVLMTKLHARPMLAAGYRWLGDDEAVLMRDIAIMEDGHTLGFATRRRMPAKNK